jgi:hypothetical protein
MNKFKSGGQWLLRPIFWEWDDIEKATAIYTLKEFDHKGPDGRVFPSLRRLYIEMEDPTEYNFATTYLGGWNHWQLIRNSNWFQEHIIDWRDELDVKFRAKALANIANKALNPDDKDNLSAAKYILDGKWIPQEKLKRGRPSKEKIAEEAQKLIADKTDVADDFKRIMSIN